MEVFMKQYVIIILIVYLLIMNLIGLILMGADKKKAKSGAWRIPENIARGGIVVIADENQLLPDIRENLVWGKVREEYS